MSNTTPDKPAGTAGSTSMQKAALYTSGIFFAAGAAGHLVRLFTGFEIAVGGVEVPVWGSLPGALAAAAIAAWMIIAARRL